MLSDTDKATPLFDGDEGAEKQPVSPVALKEATRFFEGVVATEPPADDSDSFTVPFIWFTIFAACSATLGSGSDVN